MAQIETFCVMIGAAGTAFLTHRGVVPAPISLTIGAMAFGHLVGTIGAYQILPAGLRGRAPFAKRRR